MIYTPFFTVYRQTHVVFHYDSNKYANLIEGALTSCLKSGLMFLYGWGIKTFITPSYKDF